MKKNILITCVILFLLILSFLYLDHKEDFQPRNEDVEKIVTEVPTSNKFCYERHQTATALAPYKVDEYIELEKMGTNYVGTKRGNQAGPDMTNGYVGTLTGSLNEGLITLMFDYVIEGSEQFEEEIYQMEGENIVKLRYPLIENKATLIPDKTKIPTKLIYVKEDCIQ